MNDMEKMQQQIYNHYRIWEEIRTRRPERCVPYRYKLNTFVTCSNCRIMVKREESFRQARGRNGIIRNVCPKCHDLYAQGKSKYHILNGE